MFPDCTATPDVTRRLRRAAVVSLLVGLASAAVADDLPTDRQPSWSVDVPQGVEWAEIVGPPGAEVLALHARDGRLTAYDLANGAELFSDHTFGQPSLRLSDRCWRGGADAFEFYCYDRRSVFAVTVKPRDVCGRTLGEPFQPERFQGEPNFSERLLAVAPLDRQCLIVRSDGWLALFDPTAAEPVSSRKLGEIGAFRLAVRDKTAALLCKTGGDTWLVFVREGEDLNAAVKVRFDAALPAWCELTEEGLVAVWLDRVEYWRCDGRLVKRVALPTPPQTSAIVLAEDDEAPKGAGEQGPRLIYGDMQGRVLAFDVLSGRRLWTANEGKDPESPWREIALTKDEVIARSDTVVLVLERRGGKRLAEMHRTDYDVLSAARLKDAVYAVTELGGGERPTRVWVERQELVKSGPGLSRFSVKLHAPQTPHEIRWFAGGAAVIERDRVCVYHLP